MKYIVTGLFVCVVGSAASAQSIEDFTGFRAGGSIGVGFANTDTDFPTAPAIDFEDNLNGTLFGVSVGYDHAVGDRFLLGISAEASASTVSTSGVDALATEDWPADITNVISVLLRAGTLVQDYLVYGSVGFTQAEFDGSIFNGTPGPGGAFRESYSGTLEGTTFGLGVERTITTMWSGFAEVRFTDFGEITPAITATIPFNVDTEMTEIRFGANFRF